MIYLGGGYIRSFYKFKGEGEGEKGRIVGRGCSKGGSELDVMWISKKIKLIKNNNKEF